MLKVAHVFQLIQDKYSTFSLHKEKLNINKNFKGHHGNTEQNCSREMALTDDYLFVTDVERNTHIS